MTVEELQVVISVKMEKIDAKINSLMKKCNNLGANASKAGKGTDKLSNACAKLKDRAEAGSAGTHKLSGALKALKTGAAVAAITAVTKAVKKLTDSYAETQAAQVGLESILAAQGKDVSRAKAWLQEYTKDSLIPLTDAYTAYKNLSSAGYTDDQTQSVLQNLKDSAAFARQSSLTMGEAVKSATDGIRNENSVLVDNAGVTKNLSVIWEEYAASIGKGVGSLTAAEKRLATVEGLMRETAFQTGDAARYAATFAGAQAALKAQTKQLSSALGSIFAPALQAILPYLTALAEKMTVLATRAGQVMAVLFGIKPTPIKQLATSTQTASAGLERATKKAKELKGQLLGIDELNVIEKADTSDSGGSDTTGSTGGVSTGSPINSALSNADNVIDPRITARAEEIREKLKSLKEMIQTYSPIIKGVAAVGAAAFGAAKISKWFNLAKAAVGKSPILSKGVNALGKALLYAKTSFAITKNPLKALANGFSSLWSSFKHFMGGLSPVAKFGVSVAALGGEIVVVKNAVEEYAMGNISLGQAMLQIVPTCAAVGTAMYAMLGPWGLVATAVAGVGAGIYGVISAENQMRAEALQAEFYNGVGVSISEVADQFGRMADEIVAANQPILENQATIDSAKESITATSREIDTLISGVSRGTISVGEAVPQIQQAFASLEENTKQVLDKIYDNITRALAGSVGDTLVSLGYSIPEVMGLIDKVVGNSKTKLDELKNEADELTEKLMSGKGDKTALAEQLLEINREIANLTTEADPKITAFKSAISGITLDNLNFQSADEFSAAIKNMAEKADAAKDSVSQANSALINNLETLKKSATDAKDIKYIDGIIESIQKDTIKQQGAIDTQMQQVAETIQKSFYTQYRNLAQKESPGWWEEFLGWITPANTRDMVNERVLGYFDDLDDSFAEVFNGYGYSSLTGYAKGLLDNEKAAAAQARSTSDYVAQGFAAGMQIHSPSKLFAQYGRWSLEGYTDGIKDQTRPAKDAMQRAAESIQSSFKSSFSYDAFKNLGKQAAQGLTDAFKNLSFPHIKTPHFTLNYDAWGAEGEAWRQMGLQGRPSVNVKWYAKGGVFTDRSLIGVGEYPGAASNPEIATPQSIMRDTVAGVLQSDRSNQYDVIYRAIYSALTAVGPDLFNPKVVVDLDGRSVGRGSAKYVKQELIRSGEWP